MSCAIQWDVKCYEVSPHITSKVLSWIMNAGWCTIAFDLLMINIEWCFFCCSSWVVGMVLQLVQWEQRLDVHSASNSVSDRSTLWHVPMIIAAVIFPLCKTSETETFHWGCASWSSGGKKNKKNSHFTFLIINHTHPIFFNQDSKSTKHKTFYKIVGNV